MIQRRMATLRVGAVFLGIVGEHEVCFVQERHPWLRNTRGMTHGSCVLRKTFSLWSTPPVLADRYRRYRVCAGCSMGSANRLTPSGLT